MGMAARLCFLLGIQAALLTSCAEIDSVDERAQTAALQDPQDLVGALADTAELGEAAREVKSLPAKENARGPKPQNQVPSGTTQELLGAFKSMQTEMAGIKAQQKKEKAQFVKAQEERKAELMKARADHKKAEAQHKADQESLEAKFKAVNAQLAAERESRKKAQSHDLIKAKHEFEAKLKAVTAQLDAKVATRVETETRTLREAGNVRPHTVRTAHVCAKRQAKFGYCTPTTAVPQPDGSGRQQKASSKGIGEDAMWLPLKKKGKKAASVKDAMAATAAAVNAAKKKARRWRKKTAKRVAKRSGCSMSTSKLRKWRDAENCSPELCNPANKWYSWAIKECIEMCRTPCGIRLRKMRFLARVKNPDALARMMWKKKRTNGCHMDLQKEGFEDAKHCRKWMCDAKQAAKEGSKRVDHRQKPCAECAHTGLEWHHSAMRQCRILCNVECDPSQPHQGYSGATFLPAGTLAPGHRYCKDKFTMMTTAGDNINRANSDAEPVPVCGKCVSRDFVLRPSHHVGKKVLGVCTKLKEHPLMLEANLKCTNATKPCAGVVFHKCQQFTAEHGAVEHRDPKKYLNTATLLNRREGPKSGAAFAFTCGQVQGIDSRTSEAHYHHGRCSAKLTRIVERKVVSCYTASEDKSRQECVNFKQTLSCHTHKLVVGGCYYHPNVMSKTCGPTQCQKAYKENGMVAKAYDALTKKGVGSSWKPCTEIEKAKSTAIARL